ncbi:hypothetical protein MKW92_012613 [Papaver armeniacum]|nr:hypothetical protein MKW92_012613 [Papaver armeniacum]
MMLMVSLNRSQQSGVQMMHKVLSLRIHLSNHIFSFYNLVCTQRSWKRPYGVGLLVRGLDESGAHLYYNCPNVLFAIKETLQGEKLTSSIFIVVVVGLEEDFHILDQKTIQEFIELLEIREDACKKKLDRSLEVPPPVPMDIGDL